MTANTTRARVSFRMRAFNSLHDGLVTLPASLFSYVSAARRDVYVVFKPAGREVVGVPKSVVRFGCVLGNKSGRCVAIIANRYGSMTGLDPAAELLLHDMTIHTRFGVVGHVGITARVDECVSPDADCQADQDAQNHARN